jgi:hypothetical protein
LPSPSSREIIAAPKVPGFDMGFVRAFRGWTELRPEDLGRLWKHYVLNELTAHLQTRALRYWRDKPGHAVDFIRTPPGGTPLAIECKWSARDFDPTNPVAFAGAYHKHGLLIMTPDARPAFTRQGAGRPVRFLTLNLMAEGFA